MACFKPLKAFLTGRKTEKGKPEYMITKQNVISITNAFGERVEDYTEVPCGKCIGCRLEYSKQWANRCMLETKRFEHNWFLTLTYANKPEIEAVNVESGEVEPQGTLIKKDLQDFNKRLRRYYEYHYDHKTVKDEEGNIIQEGIKFYCCGEYGDLKSRPHYHGIYFNLPIYDLEVHHKNKNGNVIYTSKTLEEIWGNGYVGIAEVNWETCAYTARYILKKQKGQTSGLVKINNELWKGPLSEFTTMSTSPAIAKGYYKENKDTFYLNDEIYIKTAKGVQAIKPARYFDKLYDLEEPEKMQKIKEHRQEIAKLKQNSKLRKTTKVLQAVRFDEEESKEEQVRRLIRNYEINGGYN